MQCPHKSDYNTKNAKEHALKSNTDSCNVPDYNKRKNLLLLLLIKNVFRVTFNRNCYKGTVHKLKS